MSLEERIRSSVDQALGALVKQVTTHADEERAAAVEVARESAFADAEQAAQTRVADAEARLQAAMDQAVAAARDEGRAVVATELRRDLDIECDARLADAHKSAETRLSQALAEAEARAAEAMKASVAAARAREREAELASASRLLDSVRGLDGAASLSEVLDALALAAAKEAARAAVVTGLEISPLHPASERGRNFRVRSSRKWLLLPDHFQQQEEHDEYPNDKQNYR